MAKYQRKWNHKPTDLYCGGVRFDESHMADADFDRIMLWTHRRPLWVTDSDLAEATAEVYRRAEQVRSARRAGTTPEERAAAYSIPVVSVSDIEVPE